MKPFPALTAAVIAALLIALLTAAPAAAQEPLPPTDAGELALPAGFAPPWFYEDPSSGSGDLGYASELLRDPLSGDRFYSYINAYSGPNDTELYLCRISASGKVCDESPSLKSPFSTAIFSGSPWKLGRLVVKNGNMVYQERACGPSSAAACGWKADSVLRVGSNPPVQFTYSDAALAYTPNGSPLAAFTATIVVNLPAINPQYMVVVGTPGQKQAGDGCPLADGWKCLYMDTNAVEKSGVALAVRPDGGILLAYADLHNNKPTVAVAETYATTGSQPCGTYAGWTCDWFDNASRQAVYALDVDFAQEGGETVAHLAWLSNDAGANTANYATASSAPARW